MILDQHKELKGHWIVISKAIKSKNDQSMKATLDTDGKMLVEKLTKHIEEEEKS
jgi:predicted metal-binding protein